MTVECLIIHVRRMMVHPDKLIKQIQLNPKLGILKFGSDPARGSFNCHSIY